MIRIQTQTGSIGVTVVIDGQLAGEDVPRIEALLRTLIEVHKPTCVFLRDVSHIDEPGRLLLCRLAANGVQLTAAGLYSAFIVDEIQRLTETRGRRAR